MQTSHRVIVGDARDLASVEDDSVELVVTSPPYPMIEMWDEVFAEQSPEAREALDRGDGQAAFEAMHQVLDEAWAEVGRVLVDGGIACLNVGDATRRVGDGFRLYPNHARVLQAMTRLGFEPLPDILWRKPTNSAAKFMGSGMLPPNAYATLEHEYILIFRNGAGQRGFEPKAPRRYESAYFWEERNAWFTDLWTDLNGERQTLTDPAARDRSAAFPFELPYRLINMFSVHGDTVLDPFWGTGTTSLAAMVAARSSIGVELEPSLAASFEDRARQAPDLAARVLDERLAAHADHVNRRADEGTPPGYTSSHYGFPVTTQQEKQLLFRTIQAIEATEAGFEVDHVPYRPIPAGTGPQDAIKQAG